MHISLDTILSWIQRTCLVGFMLSAYFIVTSSNLLTFVFAAVILLYLFIAVTYVRQQKKNQVPIDKVTQEVASIVLGTVLLIIVIVLLFKFVEALTF